MPGYIGVNVTAVDLNDAGTIIGRATRIRDDLGVYTAIGWRQDGSLLDFGFEGSVNAINGSGLTVGTRSLKAVSLTW